MNLADLRRVTVKKGLRIRFPLSNGLECIVNERGVAQVPALHAVPSFNLEQELAGVQQFVVEPASAGKDATGKPRGLTRDEMVSMTSAGAETGHDEHDD
ncbi:MAG TPA: hypothetical protein VMI94_17740 [Bryobacteraceae bacterium]|nr:hypothetical protein [Bryobacteraceae bacterium]